MNSLFNLNIGKDWEPAKSTRIFKVPDNTQHLKTRNDDNHYLK